MRWPLHIAVAALYVLSAAREVGIMFDLQLP